MLLSMTGHGHGTCSQDGLSVNVEIRTVNSRYAKVNVRCGENYQALEPRIEELVRQNIRRGTIQVNVRIDRRVSANSLAVNEEVLQQYLASLANVTAGQCPREFAVENMLGLPGVIQETTDRKQSMEADWPTMESAIHQALAHLSEMRNAEGASMEADLLNNCAAIEQELAGVQEQAPQVARNYQSRILEKINLLLGDTAEVESSDNIKEVAVFADRVDISEEVVRLKTHIEQFRKVIAASESQGRKLDFLTQEMFRETNTIGSKANDATIAQKVVEMKTAIERIREMVQNIE